MQICPQCGEENPERAKFCLNCAAPLGAAASQRREVRKTVTVLFCDVTGSTELGERLDPEPLRALLSRYFARMKAIVERHGGTVEKFIGDAVMAVFGVPVVHEDDAVRAVRAALEMREAFPELGVQGRIGVTTGEVVAGTEERLATGDAVNVAARLEQAAQPGEILIGDETLRLTRDAVEVDEVQFLELKGKAEPVSAYRLLSLRGQAARRHESAMIGRDRERRMLVDAWERVVSERSCHLFTILGPAGVGKSRLAAEFLGSLDHPLLAEGRCLPYGEGITYWPVVEVIKQLPDVEIDEVAAGTIRGLLGDEAVATSSEEIAWSFRKLLEAVASDSPLVCLFDDLHWGEATFLDLVEHVADLSRDAPILLLCMARPDLLDRRLGWAGGKVNATNVLLEPLAPEETERLIESLAPLDDGLRGRIQEASEGNPLFVEEMVALARESGETELSVPPTIQALLAARLDQLDSQDRAVLECGAVEGRVFHRGAVQALGPKESEVTARLTALVRKELVRPDTPLLPGEDAFRFRHLLIRDAAYDGLPKATRAELHERFADWLERHGLDIVELDEILGYHLEQACRYRAELGTADDELGLRAAEHLGAAGRRAYGRSDAAAAVSLLGRAVELTPRADRDVAREIVLAEALFWVGRPQEAEARLSDTAAWARSRGDRIGELLALLDRAEMRMHTTLQTGVEELRALAEEALPEFEKAGHEPALTKAWMAIGWAHHTQSRIAARNQAYEEALVHARRAQDEAMIRRVVVSLSAGYVLGPTPVEEALDWHLVQGELGFREQLNGSRAVLEAMLGRFDEARSSLAEERGRCLEFGDDLGLGLMSEHEWYAEICAGDFPAAERVIREGCERLDEMGETGWLSTIAGRLARTLHTLERDDEAYEWSQRSEELGAKDDTTTQMLWRQARGTVLARRGEIEAGEKLLREALVLAQEADTLNENAEAHMDLAEVLDLAGRREEAGAEVEQALALYERKGNVVLAERARAKLDELRERSAARAPNG